MKTAQFFTTLLFLSIFLTACTTAPSANTHDDYAVTFYPFYDITAKIIGNTGTVFSIVPSGVEPHDYEPTPQDILRLNQAKAFITTGVEFAQFEDNLIKATENKVPVIAAAGNIQLLNVIAGEEEEGTLKGKDPHIWLSPKNMMTITKNIRGGLTAISPENKAVYAANADVVLAKLTALDKEYENGLKNCNKEVVLTNHQAFAYLGRDYGFTQIAISVDPETDPKPSEIAALIDQARKYDIKYIFAETLVDHRIAETIAAEVGAQVLVLDPIEGVTNENDDYFSVMQRNLDNLRIALECE